MILMKDSSVICLFLYSIAVVLVRAETGDEGGAGEKEEVEERVQGEDSAVKCDPGYRISKIERHEGADGYGGKITVECEPLDPYNRPVGEIVCNEPKALKCDKTDEGCGFGSHYVGGMNLYHLDEDTGAYLFEPICCAASALSVNQSSCQMKRFSALNDPYEYLLPHSTAIRNFNCWQVHGSVSGKYLGSIYQAETCQFSMADGEEASGDEAANEALATCNKCTCECGPFKCPAGTTPTTVLHKTRRKRYAKCECACQCNFVCTPVNRK